METRFESMFKARLPKYVFLLNRFQSALEKEHVDFCDVNTENLHKFKNYVSKDVSANSLKTYFAAFSAFCRECYNDGLITNVKCLSALKVKKEPQQNVALTEEEVKRIFDYYERAYSSSKSKVEKDVLTLFLIECYCGARGCDVEMLTPNNIQNGMLSYVSKKTHTLAVMPAHKHLMKLIKRIPKRQYQRATKNRIVKETCKRCGIIEPLTIVYHGKMRTLPKYEYCAFHTARRSCITALLNRGVPLVQVSKMAGHSSATMTQRYYCSDKIELDENAMAFFNG